MTTNNLRSLPMDPTIFTSDERNANGYDQESPMVPAAGSEERGTCVYSM